MLFNERRQRNNKSKELICLCFSFVPGRGISWCRFLFCAVQSLCSSYSMSTRYDKEQFAILLLILAYLHIHSRPYLYSITEKNSTESKVAIWMRGWGRNADIKYLGINMDSGHQANNLNMNEPLTSGQLIKDIPIRNTNVGEQWGTTWINFLKIA